MDGKSLGQRNGETLEVVVLNKLVQVDTEHLKSYANMRPESEISVYPYDVFTVLMVLVPQCLQYLDLNLALLVEFLPVLEDLDRNMLFGLVVKAPEDHTKGTSSQFLLYLIPIENLILGFVKIVRLIIVKAMIVWWTYILLRVFILTGHFILDVLTNSFVLSIQV